MKDVLTKARELMRGWCRVCPVCDGRACAGEVPGMGSLGSGAAFRANMDSLARYRLNMRTIHNVAQPATRIDFLGRTLELPVLAAPIGGVSFNMGDKVSEDDYVNAVIAGSLQAGSLGAVGDGVPDVIHQAGYKALAAHGGAGLAFVKPWSSDELKRKLDLALEAGALGLGMDLDAIGLVTLALMGRPVGPMGIAQLSRVIESYGVPFILKGIMTPEDARAAYEAGAQAIVVSNHGGRVLDWARGAADVLPAIAQEVKGKMLILADGGIRRGVDVLKMLCLGADAVMIGRPVTIAAMGGGAQGVAKFLGQIKTELVSAMVLSACADVTQTRPDMLCPQP